MPCLGNGVGSDASLLISTTSDNDLTRVEITFYIVSGPNSVPMLPV